MTRAEVKDWALQLPEAERLALAEELWASIEDSNVLPRGAELSGWQKEVLDQRLQASAEDPGEPWEAVRSELWSETS